MINKQDLKQMNYLLSSSKKILCIGAEHAYKDFIKPYCIVKKVLPLPKAIYDSSPQSYPAHISGIPVLDLKNISQEDPYASLIIIAEEDKPFYEVLGKLYNELIAYYFPILPCTAVEAFFYVADNMDKINATLNLFTETHSRDLYKNYWLSRIYGIVYNPMLYSKYPYFGNEIIPELLDDDIIISGGTYNGKHIDRALKMNPQISAYLFEPNKKYYNLLKDSYNKNGKIKVFNYALYDTNSLIPFDLSDELGAQIVESNSKYDYMVNVVPFDELNLGRVSLVELDIEGSEVQALIGMKNTIQKYHPKLAICIYHKLSDYVEIPKLILNMNSQYTLFFRQHSCYYEESVLYAI